MSIEEKLGICLLQYPECADITQINITETQEFNDYMKYRTCFKRFSVNFEISLDAWDKIENILKRASLEKAPLKTAKPKSNELPSEFVITKNQTKSGFILGT